MRASPNIDGVRCRCGFEADGEVLMYAAGLPLNQRPLHLLHYGRMVEQPKADPGVRVSDQFSELDALCWDTRGEQWPIDGLQDAAIANGMECGLAHQPGNHNGQYLCIEREPRNGAVQAAEQLKRNVMYGIAPRGNEIEAAERMVCAIANKHGHGRWWSTLDAVHVIADDGLARVADVGGVPHVFLRAAYFHDPSCPLCGEPCDRITVGSHTINGCPCVGTDRAVAIDLSKLTKDPASQGYDYATPPRTRAGQLESVLYAAQIGAISSEVAREMLDATTPRARDRRERVTAESTPLQTVEQWRLPRGQPVYLKSQSEDLSATAEFRYKSTWSDTPIDLLDVEYDGVTLRVLLACDEGQRRYEATGAQYKPTPLQRSAISAHWSAELRAKVAASKECEHRQVTIEVDE